MLPKHGPVHLTVLKKFFVRMVWSFSKTFKSMAEPCSPKHGPILFTVLKKFFVWMFCSLLKTFKFMAGPRSPTSPVTAQLIPRRWRIASSWCYAAFQQRSNERLVVLSQTRSCSFRGVEEFFRLDGKKVFKNQWTFVGPCSPKHGPVFFTVLTKLLVWMLCSQIKTIKLLAGPRSPTSPVTAQLISRRWRIVSCWCYADFQERSNERLFVAP